MKVNVIMFHYLTAFVKFIISSSILSVEPASRKRLCTFHIRDDAVNEIAFFLALPDKMFFDVFLLSTILSTTN